MKPPYLGVAYYPEDWDEREIQSDIGKMLHYGINLVRMGEFAWHRMEPSPGQYDFTFFKRVVDAMGEAGIGVILGTPTATPPRWLTAAHPEILMEKQSGRASQHGGRRDCCSNHPVYNQYSMRIVEEMAKTFADHPAVVGWQIDNEIYPWDMGCFCPECIQQFQNALRERYGTIDALNRAWNLNLFSQWYDSFDQIPAPRDAWHHPSLKEQWLTFQSDSHIAFVKRQADILHRYVHVPVGTDTMPFGAVDYNRMFDALDVVQFNHYHTCENLWQVGFWFDHLRTLKLRPFWNTETATCWNGSAVIDQSIKPDGFCRANAWLPLALGGEANLFWLWRTHWAGHELMHGAVLAACGRPMHIAQEVSRTAQEFKLAAEFINGTRVQPDCAIHFSALSHNMQEMQPIVPGLNYTDTLIDVFYRAVTDAGLCPDVIDATKPLEPYRLLITPMMMTLEEAGIGKRIAQWVQDGGTWIVGPLTDVRNADGAQYEDRPYGLLEALTGLRWLYNAPDAQGQIHCDWQNGDTFTGKWWYEVFEAATDDALVTITQAHSALVGKAVVVTRPVGKGRVIVLGTFPSHADMASILHLACEYAHVEGLTAEGSLAVAPRRGTAGEGYAVVETGGKNATLTLREPMMELLSGCRLDGRISIAPYQTLILMQ